MSIAPSPGASVDAPPDRRTLDVVLYSSLTDTVPQPRTVAWDELADDLAEHDERTTKDGPGWSATVYRAAATRGKQGVEQVTAVVLDVDHEEPHWALLDGLEYVAHTTWKHHASDERPSAPRPGDGAPRPAGGWRRSSCSGRPAGPGRSARPPGGPCAPR
jgi:hypothetical protein